MNAFLITVALVGCAFLFSYLVNRWYERYRCLHVWVRVGIGEHECSKCGKFQMAGGPR